MKKTKKIAFIVSHVFDTEFDDCEGFDTLEEAKQHVSNRTKFEIDCSESNGGKYFISKVVSVGEVKCALVTEDVK